MPLVGQNPLIGPGPLVGGWPLAHAASGGGSDPTGLTSVALWLRAMSTTVRNAADGTGAAMSDGQAVGRWIQPSDTLASPTHVYGSEPTNKPTLEIAGGKYWVHGDDQLRLVLSSAVSLTGDFVMWAVVKRANATQLQLLGGPGNGEDIFGSFIVDAGQTIAVQDDLGNSAAGSFTGTNGAGLQRFRRVSGAVFFAATGEAEISLGTLAGTITIDTLLAITLAATWTDSADALGELLICTDSATAASPPASLDTGGSSYFAANAYLGSAAWGVSLP